MEINKFQEFINTHRQQENELFDDNINQYIYRELQKYSFNQLIDPLKSYLAMNLVINHIYMVDIAFMYSELDLNIIETAIHSFEQLNLTVIAKTLRNTTNKDEGKQSEKLIQLFEEFNVESQIRNWIKAYNC